MTGYADLDAVEGSINDSEVFRFLTKPCAPQQLRETIELAAKLARETPVPSAPEPLTGGDTSGDTIEIILQSDTVTEVVGRLAACAATVEHGRPRAAEVRPTAERPLSARGRSSPPA